MFHLKARGRGSKFTPSRGLVESALSILYTGGWPAALWKLWPNASRVQLLRHTIHAPSHTPTCRLAFASDLHIGPTTPRSVLDRAAALIRDANPDALLLGGDYMFLDATRRKRERLKQWISDTRVETVIAVVGNHDLWGEEEKILGALGDAGALLLVNQSTRLPPPFDSIAIVGLDDPMTGSVNSELAFSGTADADVRIVLCHEPDGLLHCNGLDFDLYLCGHTHGGQVSTPWGPITLPPGELHREFYAGFHQHHERHLFVSRGLGGAEVPVRLYAPPDLLLIDVKPVDNTDLFV